MNKSQTISVIIPTNGNRLTITNCINSLIDQSSLPDEIVIVNNSTHDISYMIKTFISHPTIVFRLINESKKGASYARNAGIHVAKGVILAFIDDDCIAHSDWLRSLISSLNLYGEGSIVKGSNHMYPRNNRLISHVDFYNDELFFQSSLYKYQSIVFSKWIDSKNFGIYRSIIKKYHIHFNKYYLCEDLDFSLQAHTKDLSIMYDSGAIVYHDSRKKFKSLLIKQLHKGIDRAALERKWNKKYISGENAYSPYISIISPYKSEKYLRNTLLKNILKELPLIKKMGFYFLEKISFYLSNLSYALACSVHPLANQSTKETSDSFQNTDFE